MSNRLLNFNDALADVPALQSSKQRERTPMYKPVGRVAQHGTTTITVMDELPDLEVGSTLYMGDPRERIFTPYRAILIALVILFATLVMVGFLLDDVMQNQERIIELLENANG